VVTSTDALLTRTPVRINDQARMCDYLSRETSARLRVRRLGGGGALQALALDTWNLTHSRLALPDVLVQGGPTTGIWVAHLLAGRWEQQAVVNASRYTVGDAWLLLPTDAPSTFHSLGAHLGLTHLYPSVLAQVAATSPTPGSGPIRFTSNQAVTPAAGRRWDRIARYMFNVLNDDAVARQPLLLGNAARLIAGAALSTFPNTAVTDPTATDRWDACAATLHRALAYMEEHLGEDISVADLAAAAHVSVRAIQLAFRRHLDTTPTARLRGMRLERARLDLLEADPRRCTIAEVATRWGFSPSRFAGYFRQAYGVHPGEVFRST
jgi:AraC-like DNA-binding protein